MKKRPIILQIIMGGMEEEECPYCGMGGCGCEEGYEDEDEYEDEECPECGKPYDKCKCED
jgi:DNA-directed RNA polymerase subunit RPC12/RpoP